MRKNRKISIYKKNIVLYGLLLALPLIASGQALIIKNSDGTKKIENCTYTNSVIEESGKLVLILKNFSCLNTDTGGTDTGGTDTGDKLVDLGTLGDNTTYSLGKHPTNGYEVYTLDLGRGGATAAPSCANDLNILHECEGKGSWNKGAKTTEVYAIRAEKKLGRAESISKSQLAYGVNVTGAFFDFTVSANPGDIDKTTFEGKGCIKKTKLLIYDINLITDAQYNKFKSQLHLFDACYVPEGSKYYINIRATDEYCDHAGELREDKTRIGNCNSYFEMH
jgi:hypothetical protein